MKEEKKIMIAVVITITHHVQVAMYLVKARNVTNTDKSRSNALTHSMSRKQSAIEIEDMTKTAAPNQIRQAVLVVTPMLKVESAEKILSRLSAYQTKSSTTVPAENGKTREETVTAVPIPIWEDATRATLNSLVKIAVVQDAGKQSASKIKYDIFNRFNSL